jgi:small subunit ribosomal protein S18
MARDGESRSFRRKFCKLCLDKVERIDYKDDRRLARFITDRGKIVPRRISGTCARHQAQITEAVKRARILALLPFTSDQYR